MCEYVHVSVYVRECMSGTSITIDLVSVFHVCESAICVL